MDYKIKQTLKEEFIEQDIKKELQNHLLWSIAIFPFFILCILAFVYFCINFGLNKNTIILLIIGAVIFSIYLTLIIREIINYAHRNERYTIITDRLVDTKYHSHYKRLSLYSYLRLPYRASGMTELGYCFAFSNKERIFIINPQKTYYPWSKDYNMLGRLLINSSNIGEDFYLVLVNKRIVSVYNKKMFELSEELKCGVDNGI